VSLANANNIYGVSWGMRGMIAFTPAIGSAIMQVPDSGGSPQTLTRLEKGDATQLWPEWMPGQEALLFTSATRSTAAGDALISVFSIKTGERRNLFPGSDARYAPTGHVIYLQPGTAETGTLMAAPFDAQRLQVTGPSAPVVEGVLQDQLGVAHSACRAPAHWRTYPEAWRRFNGSLYGSVAMVWSSRSPRLL
jgi:hypothetical protein